MGEGGCLRRKERRRKKAEERDNVRTKVVEIYDEEWEKMKEKDKGKSGATTKAKGGKKKKGW